MRQKGKDAEVNGNTSTTKVQHALLDSVTVQALECTQQPLSVHQCGGLPVEALSEQECSQPSSDQHPGVHGDESTPTTGKLLQAAMRELDLGIMMGGLTYQESLHAAMAIAQKAWHDSDKASNAGILELGQNKHIECKQIGHTQTAHSRKRARSVNEGRSSNGPSSSPAVKDSARDAIPTPSQHSMATAAWASADLGTQDVSKWQQNLPPGEPDRNSNVFIPPRPGRHA